MPFIKLKSIPHSLTVWFRASRASDAAPLPPLSPLSPVRVARTCVANGVLAQGMLPAVRPLPRSAATAAALQASLVILPELGRPASCTRQLTAQRARGSLLHYRTRQLRGA
jgi:hypothetical protein